MAEAVLNTVPDLPVKYTGLLLFPDLYAACMEFLPTSAAEEGQLALFRQILARWGADG